MDKATSRRLVRVASGEIDRAMHEMRVPGFPRPYFISYLIRDDNRLLSEGRSRHLFVEEDAQVLVLMRAGVEVRRVELDLEPRRQNLLRL